MMFVTPTVTGLAMEAAITSTVVCVVIVASQSWHGRYSLDHDLTSVQKFHAIPAPRIGGIALALGILMPLVLSAFTDFGLTTHENPNESLKLLLASMPAFVTGIVEDMTKTVSVRKRLLATIASPVVACLLSQAYLPRLDIWGLDAAFQSTAFAIGITAFLVAGVANSINIIDGFHGVAGSTVAIILAAMGFLAWEVEDLFVLQLALLGIGAIVGFLVINYPTGRLFMGDGGAYLIGFWTAEVAVLLVARNPQIGAWQVLGICAYPVIEVLNSIYRRTVIRKISASTPDRLHLHTLIYRRVTCQFLPRGRVPEWGRNAAVAGIVILWLAPMTLLAVWIGDTLVGAISVLAIEVLSYIAIYTRLVRGRWCFNPAVVFRVILEPSGYRLKNLFSLRGADIKE